MTFSNAAKCFAILLMAIAGPVAFCAQVESSKMTYMGRCYGRVANGHVLVYRTGELYMVPADALDAPAKPIGRNSGVAGNLTCAESDATNSKICLSGVDPLRQYSSLLFGPVGTPINLLGTPDIVILDADLAGSGAHVNVLYGIRFGGKWSLELKRITMKGVDTSLWRKSFGGEEIVTASIRDSFIVMSTPTITRTMHTNGSVVDSIPVGLDFVHIANTDIVLALTQGSFKRYTSTLDMVESAPIPGGIFSSVRSSDDAIGITTPTHIMLLNADGTIYAERVSSRATISGAVPNGTGGLYVVTSDWVLLSVHPDRPHHLRFQIESEPPHPMFCTRVHNGISTTFKATSTNPIISWYYAPFKKWIVLQNLLGVVQLWTKDIACVGETLAILYEGGGQYKTGILFYNTSTGASTTLLAHETFDRIHLMRSNNILLLQRVDANNKRVVAMNLNGVVLDSTEVIMENSLTVNDSLVVFNERGASVGLTVGPDGRITTCVDFNLYANGKTAPAIHNERTFGAGNDMLTSYARGCTDIQTQPMPIPGITSVLAIRDTRMYVIGDSVIVSAFGEKLLSIKGLLYYAYTDLFRVYVYSRADEHMILDILTLDFPVPVPPAAAAPSSNSLRSMLLMSDGTRIVGTANNALPNTTYVVYSSLGEELGVWNHSGDTSHMQLPAGMYVAIPIE